MVQTSALQGARARAAHARRFWQACLRHAALVGLLTAAGLAPAHAAISFDTVKSFPTGNGARAMASADFDGDGRPDLVTANADTVSVLLTTSTGEPGAPVNYSVGGFPVAVAVGDLNGDGAPDLVTANYNSDKVSVLLNNGDGTFRTAVTYVGGSSVRSVALGDFNGDGKLDIAVDNFDNRIGSVSILLGDGQGGFDDAGRSNYLLGAVSNGIAVADLNEDGRSDVIVASEHGLRVLLNDGAGGFGAVTTYNAGDNLDGVVAADLNGDRHVDLMVSRGFGGSGVYQMLNDGQGNLQRRNVTGDAAAVAVPIEATGDGLLDVAVAADDGSVTLYAGQPGGDFQPTGPAYHIGLTAGALVVADFDGDGKSDLAVMDGNAARITVLRGRGSQGFAGPRFYPTRGNPLFVTAGDFDKDGRPDVAVVQLDYPDSSVVVLHNDGQGGLVFDGRYPVAAVEPVAIVQGDFDGDGKLDFAVVNGLDASVFGFLNDGSGGFNPLPVATLTGVSALAATAGTFSGGDGRSQVALLAKSQTQNVYAMFVLGMVQGTLQNVFSDVVVDPQSLAPLDFDGDGRADLLLGSSTGRAGAWVQSASTPGIAFSAAPSYTAPLSGSALRSASSWTVGGQPGAFFGAGNSVVAVSGFSVGNGITATGSAPAGLRADVVAAADLDGDGLPDAVVADSREGQGFAVLRGLGGVALAGAQAFPLGGAATSMATADFNGDGLPDVVLANNFGGVTVVLNTTPSANSRLAGLAASVGSLNPVFTSGTTSYALQVPNAATQITLTPVAAGPGATITVNGQAVSSGSPSAPLTLAVGDNLVPVVVESQDMSARTTYIVAITRAASTQWSGQSGTGSGPVQATVVNGGPSCSFDTGQFTPAASAPVAPPAGWTFPHGLFDFRTVGCDAGAAIDFTITYPATLPSGAAYWKFGPTADNRASHWYRMPGAVVTGNTVRFTVTDGGLGDDDGSANGAVADPGGIGVLDPALAAAAVSAIPALSHAALAALALLLALGVGLTMRRGGA